MGTYIVVNSVPTCITYRAGPQPPVIHGNGNINYRCYVPSRTTADATVRDPTETDSENEISHGWCVDNNGAEANRGPNEITTSESACFARCDTDSDLAGCAYIVVNSVPTCITYRAGPQPPVIHGNGNTNYRCYVPSRTTSSWELLNVGPHCLPNDWCDQERCTNTGSQGVATWNAFAKRVSSEYGSACLERVSADGDCGDYAFFKAGHCFCTRASGSNDCVRTATWAGTYEVHTRGTGRRRLSRLLGLSEKMGSVDNDGRRRPLL